MDINIKVIDKITPSFIEAATVLLSQLTDKPVVLSEAYLNKMIESPDTILFIAERLSDQKVVGILVLNIKRILVGAQSHIDDVIVDESMRGLRIGERLVREAIKKAKEHGALFVHLTSRSSRVAANALYKKIGFQPYETNVYRYKIL